MTVTTRSAAHRSTRAIQGRGMRRGAALGLATLIVGAVGASAAGASGAPNAPASETGRTCQPGYLWLNIGGRVMNHTDATLHRIHVQTGLLNIDAPVPKPEVAPRATNKWCIKAPNIPLAGAQIELEYRLPNDSKVHFRASVFPTIFGGGSEGCHVTGPHHAYTCRATRTHRGPHADVDFVVAQSGG